MSSFALLCTPFIVRNEIFGQMDPLSCIEMYRTLKTNEYFFPVVFPVSIKIRFNLNEPYLIVKSTNGEESEVPFDRREELLKTFVWIDLEEVEIEFDEFSESSDFHKLLEFIEETCLQKFTTLRIFSKNQDILDISVFYEVLSQLEPEKKTILDCGIVEYPYGLITSPLVIIRNGTLMDETEIKKVYMASPEARIYSSRLSDTGFNLLIRDWLNGGDHQTLKYLEIAAGSRKRKFDFERQGIDYLLKDIGFIRRGKGEYQSSFGLIRFSYGWDIMRSDGATATILRRKDNFVFVVNN